MHENRCPHRLGTDAFAAGSVAMDVTPSSGHPAVAERDEGARIVFARPHPLPHRPLLIASALCWIAFIGLVAVVASGGSLGFDAAGLQIFRAEGGAVPRGPTRLLEWVRDVTALGGVLLRNLIALGAVVALLFLGLRREALLITATVVIGWLVNTGLKLAIERPRPQIVRHLTEAGGNSFPSGHSFNAAVAYTAIALAFVAMARRTAVRATILVSATLLTLAVAFSRVWLGVHWPSDALAGWLGGTGWALLAAALFDRPAQQAAQEAAPAINSELPGVPQAGADCPAACRN